MAKLSNGVPQFAPRRTREQIEEAKTQEITRGQPKISQSRRYENVQPGTVSEKRRHLRKIVIGGAVDGTIFSIVRRWAVEVWLREDDRTDTYFARTRRDAERHPLRVDGSIPELVELPGHPSFG